MLQGPRVGSESGISQQQVQHAHIVRQPHGADHHVNNWHDHCQEPQTRYVGAAQRLAQDNALDRKPLPKTAGRCSWGCTLTKSVGDREKREPHPFRVGGVGAPWVGTPWVQLLLPCCLGRPLPLAGSELSTLATWLLPCRCQLQFQSKVGAQPGSCHSPAGCAHAQGSADTPTPLPLWPPPDFGH